MNADWLAMREWLIGMRANAKEFAESTRTDFVLSTAWNAQVEVLSAALDFMDERERRPRTGAS